MREHTPSLVLDIRGAIAEFFSVPESKIFPADNLSTDYEYQVLEPAFHFFVLHRVFRTRVKTPKPFVFSTPKNMTLREFAQEVARVLQTMA